MLDSLKQHGGMLMHKSLLVGAAAATLAVGTALPAAAGTTGTTATTFTLTSGGLSINVPSAANLGSAAVDSGTITGQLGAVTVTDDRSGLATSWTVTASSSDFTTGGSTAAETIDSDQINYAPGSPTAETGSATFTPGTAGPLYPARTAFYASNIIGNNSATWDPTLTVAVPAQAISGTYSGTVTHAVN